MKTSLKIISAAVVAVAAFPGFAAVDAAHTVSVPVCAKADLPAGNRDFRANSALLIPYLAAGDGCYERLGRLGGSGYARGNVVLMHQREDHAGNDNIFAVYIDGTPIGYVFRYKPVNQ